MNKINFAILGPGKIAKRFVNGKSDYCNYYSVCGRDLTKAESFAKEHNINKYYSIEECLNDPDVDAIYVSTPNATHYKYVKMCLEHKKSVLCEKPFLGTKEECIELYDLAKSNGVMLMEADKQLFLPLTKKIKEIINNKTIGDVKYMLGYYCDNREGKPVFEKDHWVFDKLTGGSIRDIGIYPIAYFNHLNDWNIKTVSSVSRNLYEVDCFAECSIVYENNVFATAVSGFDIDLPKGCEIYGTKGRLHIKNFWKTGEATIIMNDGSIEEIHEEMISDFKYETDHFCKCVMDGLTESPVIGKAESLKLIDIFDSVK